MNDRISVWQCLIVGSLALFAGATRCEAQNVSSTATNIGGSGGSGGSGNSSDYVIMQRGPNSRVWGTVSLQTNDDGETVSVTNQAYVELATGSCYLTNGVYVDSVEEIAPVAGGARAVLGQHQVQWANNANTPGGAVTVVTPDGKQLSSAVFGLAYYDLASGSNAPISWLQNCNGGIVAPNQVLYANAFSNVTADIDYTYTRAGISQDILIRGAPPAPHAYGLSDATSVLQIYTWFNAPQPEMTAVTNGNVVDDQVISFGAMQMGLGQAFFLEGQGSEVAAGIVTKQWVQANGSSYLVEAIGYSAISNQLQQLPQASNLKPGSGSVRRMAFIESKPSRPSGRAKEAKPMKLARAETAGPRLKIDYDLLNYNTNALTLQGDTTYYVSGLVNLTNTLTIGGGTVVKYTNGAGAQITAATIVCATGMYSPGVFTSKDDNSVGSTITGGSGAPTQGTNIYLNFGTLGTNAPVYSNLRFSYAGYGIYGINNESSTNSIDIWDCQFVNCGNAFYCTVVGSTSGWFPVNVYNVLFSRCAAGVAGYSDNGHLNISLVNVTADQVAAIAQGVPTTNVCNATNCLFTGTNTSGIVLTYCTTNMSSNGFYEPVGAANYYLTNGSTNLVLGTTSINPALLADLQARTTYGPTVLPSGFLTTSTNLSVQVPRDTNGTALGYHYSPLDYALNIIVSTNVTVTVTPGIALAIYGSNTTQAYGVWLYYNATFNCQGTATSPNYLVGYNTVQEQSNTNWETTTGSLSSLLTQEQADSSSASFGFTEWSVMAGGGQIAGNTASCPIALANCQFYSGAIAGGGPLFSVTNCLFQRIAFTVTDHRISVAEAFYNCLFLEGSLTVTHTGTGTFTFRDNLFDQTLITNTSGATITVCSNNAYVTGFTTLLPENHDVTLTNSPAYEVGALGENYYPASMTNLIFGGSQSAAAAGLYWYTVTTNNVIDGTSNVSIGFHYVATTNGAPLDLAGDGLADYLKNSDGNGLYGSGVLANWLSPFNIYDQGSTAGNLDPSHLRLGYWKFDTNTLTSQAGQGVMSSNLLSMSNSFSGSNVSLNNASSFLEYSSTYNGENVIDVANGTVSFWFQPNWSPTNSSAPSSTVFLEAGGTGGYWELQQWKSGNGNYYFKFLSENQAGQIVQPWSFSTGGVNGAPVNFQSNLWYQIVLTYSPTNVALYTNGVLLATANTPPTIVATGGPNYQVGNGNLFYPPLSSLTVFSFGNEDGTVNTNGVLGQLDELQTFNYPMTAEQVGAGYPYFGGNTTNTLDTYYVGRSDMLQNYVDGVWPNVSGQAAPCRLGYWRFDSPTLMAEQGVIPTSQSGVTLVPSWSGTAANIGSSPGSQLTYPDVGSNGWANINCRNGSVRFWYKPNTSSGTGPFVYMGSTNGSDQWDLVLTNSGTAINFVTQTNNLGAHTILNAELGSPLSKAQWIQIVLVYGTNACALYTNGVLAATNTFGNTAWPSLSNRELGMVIGNTTAYNASINGQFEEMETFNYQLTPAQISSNFQVVASVDSNLNGIPDLLEDIQLPTARPFLGAPVVITGTIEAEQFDMGSNGVGYSTAATHPTNSYRPTGMLISTCNDLGLGYCLDQMQAGDWTQYAINVLAAGTYTVEVRAEAIGTSTGGIFQCDFTNNFGLITNGGFTNSTGPLTNTSTVWTNYSAVVYLTNGINVMKLHCLTDAPEGTNVGRFNYISIYPYWAPPTNGLGRQPITASSLQTGSDYLSASGNANVIQTAVNALGSSGGVVTIPAGTYYVAQYNNYPAGPPNDLNPALENAAVVITGNNIEITGAGETSTTLIAHNRATTIFDVGVPSGALCTNFTICNMTLQASPHLVATNSSPGNFTNIWEAGQLLVTASSYDTGSTCSFEGEFSNLWANNILITNCQFLYGYRPINLFEVSNCVISDCTIIKWGGTNQFTGATNNSPTNTANTTNYYINNVGLFGYDSININIISNFYNGNASLVTNTLYNGFVNTNTISLFAADGFIYSQSGGNCFVARNVISNNALEAVQLNGGPNSVVGNTFGTVISCGAACALSMYSVSYSGLTGWGLSNYSTTFIGNSVYGDRFGQRGIGTGFSTNSYTINFNGNYLDLAQPFDEKGDFPGAAVYVQSCQAANVFGNTMVSGGHGVLYGPACTNAVIMNNLFGNVTYRAIGYLDFPGYVHFLQNAAIFGNVLGEGVSFHAQVDASNSLGWFFKQNQYYDGASSVPVFLDPAYSSAHVSN